MLFFDMPVLLLSPREWIADVALPPTCARTPENARVTYHLHPLLGPREGKGEAANFEFFPFLGDPRECTGYIALPPSCGSPSWQG